MKTKEQLQKALCDAGIHPQKAERIVNEPDLFRQMRLLKMERCRAVELLHAQQEKLEILDYLIFTWPGEDANEKQEAERKLKA